MNTVHCYIYMYSASRAYHSALALPALYHIIFNTLAESSKKRERRQVNFKKIEISKGI